MSNDKPKKERPKKYEKPFVIKGSFEDVIKVAVTPKQPQPPKEKKD